MINIIIHCTNIILFIILFLLRTTNWLVGVYSFSQVVNEFNAYVCIAVIDMLNMFIYNSFNIAPVHNSLLCYLSASYFYSLSCHGVPHVCEQRRDYNEIVSFTIIVDLSFLPKIHCFVALCWLFCSLMCTGVYVYVCEYVYVWLYEPLCRMVSVESCLAHWIRWPAIRWWVLFLLFVFVLCWTGRDRQMLS